MEFDKREEEFVRRINKEVFKRRVDTRYDIR